MSANPAPNQRARLQQQHQAEAKQKQLRLLIVVGLIVIALVVVGIFTLVLVKKLGNNGPVATGDQQRPPNATEANGVMVTSQGTQPADDVPTVVIYEDYQCPACAAREEAYGPALKQLVDAGEIKVERVLATFLDVRLQNDSSVRAAQAASAADAVGKFREYHEVIFANQPKEGVGFTEQQLRVDFPAQAGITGDDLTKFQELYDAKVFTEFVEASGARLIPDGVNVTPTFKVNGNELVFYDREKQQLLIEPTAESMLAAIKATA